MSNINNITITGRIGKEPEMKYFENGTVLTNISLASNKWDAKKKEEKTLWFKVVCFNKLAEFVGEYAKKGQAVAVNGSLDTEEWEKDGAKNYKLVITANNIDLGSRKQSDEENNADELIGEDEIPF